MILDSTCVVPLVSINKEDCIGDTVGKYNYNSLALDTTICNLSSYIYASKASEDLPYLIDTYSGFYDIINASLYNEFKKAATTVNLLSSYWGHYEFSIQMPINAVSLSSNDVNILALRLSSINLQTVESLVQSNLKSLVETNLNIDYPPSSYIDNTIVNVSFFVYNIVPVIKDPSTNIDPLVRTKIYPIASFNYNNRLIEAEYRRDNVHVSTGIVLRFIVENRKWVYIGYYLNDQINTASPNYNNQVIQQIPEEIRVTASDSKNVLGSCEPINENSWYSLEKYVYANSLYSGTSTKLGTITITLRTPMGNIEYFSYKASGYNPNTNTGGTDVFIEINGTVINVYEQYPIKKTLVKSWISPFAEVKGVNFKFTKDNKGVSFSACASTNII